MPSRYPTGRGFVEMFLAESAIDFSNMDDEENKETFDQYWQKAGEVTVEAFVKKALPSVNPSRGYRLLTFLAQQGYFRMILTTNVDTLLDQAFAMADPSLRNHQIVSHPALQPREIADMLTSDKPPVKIVKLHGDLRSGRFLFTAKDTERFPPTLEDTIRNILHRDLITVGYSFQDADVKLCMLNAPMGIKRPSRYCVNRTGLGDETISVLEQWPAQTPVGVETICGEEGDFDRFFEALYAEIMQYDPKASVTFQSSLADKDLQGFAWYQGRYWVEDQLLMIGSNDAEATIHLSRVWLGEANLQIDFQFRSARGPSDWFGVLVGASSPYWATGHLIYVRSDGSLEVLQPNGPLRFFGKLELGPQQWVRLQISYGRGVVGVSAAAGGGVEIHGSVQFDSQAEGLVYLWTYHTEVVIQELRVAPSE
ncbi:MAG: SIR2 family protein [Bacteroidetes bacterium]|nr:SIR2 family protein [Bacteroidota bacterium]MCL5025980.1 SIR2 family protein [Chloroflexota bacterium]